MRQTKCHGVGFKIFGAGLFVAACFSLVHANTKLYVIDVGYGTAVHLETRTRNYLFDTGPKEAVSKLLKTLADQKVARLQAVFISHDHPDHTGALEKLLSQVPVDFVFWPDTSGLPPYLKSIEKIKHGAPKIRIVSHGTALPLDRETTLNIFPSTLNTEDPNDDSLVFGITHKKKTKILLAGDIGPERQMDLVNNAQEWLKDARWVLWPHHGDSLSQNFIDVFKKRPICVVSVGDNPFGLPATTLDTQAGLFCQSLYSTDTVSDMMFTVNRDITLLQLETLSEQQ